MYSHCPLASSISGAKKATSNICTNNSLCALAAVMYMATLGGSGFKELAQAQLRQVRVSKEALARAGFKLPFSQATFNEFVVEFPGRLQENLSTPVEEKNDCRFTAGWVLPGA